MSIALKTMVAIFVALNLTNCGTLLSQPSNHREAVEVPQTWVFECDDYEFSVHTNSPNKIALYLPDRTLSLDRVPAASGTKYQNSQTLFWSRGNSAVLELDEKTFNNCHRNTQREPRDVLSRKPVDFRATGNEPGWLLEIVNEQSILMLSDYGNNRVVVPVPSPQLTEAAKIYETETEAHKIRIIIRQKSCTDTMSGEKFESQVTVNLDGETFIGCGGKLG